jgi:Fic family protein
MTDQQIERFLKSLTSNPPGNRDEEEVAGYANLLGRIFDNWQNLKLSESLILSFHEIILHYSKKDQIHKGKYKTRENLVVAQNEKGDQVIIFKPTEAWLTKKEMDDVLYWTNEIMDQKKMHPLLIIANFVFEFLAIHPFSDGNGRLSRALTNLLLLRTGYEYIPYVSLEEIIEERKEIYYTSLRQTQKNHKTEHEDIGPWLNFFLDALITQAESASELITADDPTKLLSGRQIEVYTLFEEACGEGKSSFSVLEVKEKLQHIPEVTIKQSLSRLVSLKLIERNGLGRGTRYVKSS